MNKQQIIDAITHWQELVQALECRLDALYELVGGDYGSPLGDGAQSVIDAYTALQSRELGDDQGWLDYWRFECEWGKRPRKVEIDGKGRIIASVQDLAEVIMALRDR